MKKIVILLLSFTVLCSLPIEAQSKKKKKELEEAAKAKALKEKTEKEKEQKIKPYEKVITKDAVSDQGLFTTHKIKDNYYFEIPVELLDKEMLLVSVITSYSIHYTKLYEKQYMMKIELYRF